jgi:hypothetical protein
MYWMEHLPRRSANNRAPAPMPMPDSPLAGPEYAYQSCQISQQIQKWVRTILSIR